MAPSTPMQLAPDLVRFAAYIVLAVVAALARRRVDGADRTVLGLVGWAAVIAGVAMFIGLAGLLASIGREVAWGEGWYADRRPVQATIIVVLALGAIAVLAALPAMPGGFSARGRVLLASLLTLGAYVAIRAVSLHQVDAILYDPGPESLRVGDVIELALVAASALAVVLVARPGRHPE